MRTEEENADCPEGIECLQINALDDMDESIMKSINQDQDPDEELNNINNKDNDVDEID